jgi:hypothetical protein
LVSQGDTVRDVTEQGAAAENVTDMKNIYFKWVYGGVYQDDADVQIYALTL